LVALPSLPVINDTSTTIEPFLTNFPSAIVYGGKTYLPSPVELVAPKVSKDMERGRGRRALQPHERMQRVHEELPYS
jgi:hypothetical protein